MAGRSTKAELDLRVSTVYGLLASGNPRAEILQFAADNWDVSERTGDKYIELAREKIRKDCDMARPAFLAESLAGIRQVRVNATRRGQHQVALNAIRLQCELVGLTGKTT